MSSLAGRPFLKMNGLGNEIVVLDLRSTKIRVQPEEARRIRPLKLQIVVAQRGDTAQNLAARMPIDRPLERFLLINGLDRNASLKVGERYKIVVE